MFLVLNGANLPYFVLLGAGLALFGISIVLAGGDDDGGDIEADGDGGDFDADGGDVDADGGGDGDADGDDAGEESGSQTSTVGALLAALGVGKAPLLLLLAVDFSLWGFFGLLANILIGAGTRAVPTELIGMGGLVFVGSLALALFFGSKIAWAIGGVMRTFSEDSRADRLIGCLGTVSSAQMSKDRIAQIDAIDPGGNLVTVSARLPEWAQETPQRGDKVTIIDRQPDGYVAIAESGLDRQRWLS